MARESRKGSARAADVFVTSIRMTISAMLVCVTPPRNETAPTNAYAPGLAEGPPAAANVNTDRRRSISKPIRRP